MKRLLIVLLFCPLLIVAQTKPKPSTPAKKPTTTTATKKPATGTPAKKPATTATAKKPATGTPAAKTPVKKQNPQVKLLVEQANKLFNESKDAECEKVIKKILALEPKNKEAFLLRANIAMFENKFDAMFSNLDKIYKYYPKEPEIYSTFAMTHLNYYFLSDSAKRVLCRKTIRLNSRIADGYAALGMVAAVGGYYNEALNYFDISYNKYWKDTLSRVILDLPYANCLYSVGDTVGAISRLERIIPRMGGKDKYTCIFLRAKYKLELNRLDVSEDLDTLNSYAPDQPEVLILNAKYLSKTNRMDSACMMAKRVRLSEGGEVFDLSPYCSDIQTKLDMKNIKKLSYSMGMSEFDVNIDEFNYPSSIKFQWYEGQGNDKTKWKTGLVNIGKKALDSAYVYTAYFENESEANLDKTTTFWLSKLQLSDLAKDSTTRLNMSGTLLNQFKLVGHEQIEIFDAKNNEFLVDCVVLYDGTNKICYLNDPANPLLVKFETEKYSYILVKVE